MSDDQINRPKHYTSDPSGVECIEIVRHRNFNVGNAIKYLFRAGLKVVGIVGTDDTVRDLNKAMWYLADEIARIGGKVTCKHPAMMPPIQETQIQAVSDTLRDKFNELCREKALLMRELSLQHAARVKAEDSAAHLEEFKAYVHKRLDQAGVPEDPSPMQTRKTGCRIESRLDHVLRPRASASDVIFNDPPTHRCRVCGALWWRGATVWSLRSPTCGECCDNAPMDKQIEPLSPSVPPIKGPAHAAYYLLWFNVAQWLANDVLGCTPDQLVATDPEQNFRPVANVEPLMRILGGAWAAAADRAHAVKEAQRDARPGAIIGGTVDGAFMADTLARGKGPVQPPAGVSVKPFVHAAGIGTDAEPKAPA